MCVCVSVFVLFCFFCLNWQLWTNEKSNCLIRCCNFRSVRQIGWQLNRFSWIQLSLRRKGAKFTKSKLKKKEKKKCHTIRKKKKSVSKTNISKSWDRWMELWVNCMMWYLVSSRGGSVSQEGKFVLYIFWFYSFHAVIGGSSTVACVWVELRVQQRLQSPTATPCG